MTQCEYTCPECKGQFVPRDQYSPEFSGYCPLCMKFIRAFPPGYVEPSAPPQSPTPEAPVVKPFLRIGGEAVLYLIKVGGTPTLEDAQSLQAHCDEVLRGVIAQSSRSGKLYLLSLDQAAALVRAAAPQTPEGQTIVTACLLHTMKLIQDNPDALAKGAKLSLTAEVLWSNGEICLVAPYAE